MTAHRGLARVDDDPLITFRTLMLVNLYFNLEAGPLHGRSQHAMTNKDSLYLGLHLKLCG